MTKQEVDNCRYWLNTILEESTDKLNEWEENFINNIELLLNRGMDLTSKQMNTLENIYNKTENI